MESTVMDEMVMTVSVSELNAAAGRMLETAFDDVWVSGEVSQFKAYPSGHCYFTLKDEKAALSCVLFRGLASQENRSYLFDGSQVRLRGNLTLYAERGQYQLVVRAVLPDGEGALRLAIAQLRETLLKRGWLDPAHKKPIPRFPRCIGIVTSAEGAALQDVLSVLKRRAPFIPIRVYPALVQGREAPESLVRAITQAGNEQLCDVLLIVRGGGSLEDLMAFCDERVLEAVFYCPLPTVAGVGHEVDTTLVDEVADLRAPTPSVAAELVSPDRDRLLQEVAHAVQRLQQAMGRHRQHAEMRLSMLQMRLVHPRDRVKALRVQCEHLEQRLIQRIGAIRAEKTQKLALLEARLQGLHPMAPLKRGYALVRDAKGHVIAEAATFPDCADITFCDGSVAVTRK